MDEILIKLKRLVVHYLKPVGYVEATQMALVHSAGGLCLDLERNLKLLASRQGIRLKKTKGKDDKSLPTLTKEMLDAKVINSHERKILDNAIAARNKMAHTDISELVKGRDDCRRVGFALSEASEARAREVVDIADGDSLFGHTLIAGTIYREYIFRMLHGILVLREALFRITSQGT